MLSTGAINSTVIKTTATHQIREKEIAINIQSISNISAPRDLIDRPMTSFGISSAQTKTPLSARIPVSAKSKKAIYHPPSSNRLTAPASQIIQQFRDNENLIEQLPSLSEKLSESKSRHINRFASQCDDIFKRKESLRKKIRQNARNAWGENKKNINDALKNIDDEKLKKLFNTLSAVGADRQAHCLDIFWEEVISLSITCEERKNYRRLWEFILGCPHLEAFLRKFDLWLEIQHEIRELLKNNDKFFSTMNNKQKTIIDKIHLFCAPIETKYHHQLCEIDYTGKNLGDVIDLLINNKGLKDLLSENGYGKALWAELNGFPTIFKLDTLKNEIGDLVSSYKLTREKLNQLERKSLFSRIWQMSNILYRIPRTLNDLKNRHDNKVKFGEEHILHQDLLFNALDRLQNAGVDSTFKSLVTRDAEFQDMVVNEIGLTTIAEQASPRLLYDPTECYDFICMASMLDVSHVIAENIRDTEKLYHLIRDYYPHPQEVDAFFFTYMNSQESHYDRGIMLAISRLLPPALDWPTRSNLLLGVIGNSAYDIPPITEYLLPAEVNIVDALHPTRLERRYQHALNLDKHLVDKLNITRDQQINIKSSMMDFLLSRNRFSDPDTKLSYFRLDIATILNLLPDKLSSDLLTHALSPSHFFKFHAMTNNTLLTATLIKEIDHFYILHQLLDKMLDEIFSAHEHICLLKDILEKQNASMGMVIYSNIAQALLEETPFVAESGKDINLVIERIFSDQEMARLTRDEGSALSLTLNMIRKSLADFPQNTTHDFFSQVAELGFNLDADSQQTILKTLSDSIAVDITNETRSCQILSYILRKSFVSSDIMQLPTHADAGQPHDFLNTLTSGLISQINDLIATELDTALSAFNPGYAEADRYTKTACQLIAGGNPQQVLKNLIETDHKKTPAQRFTEDEFTYVRRELLTFLTNSSQEHQKHINNIFGELRKTKYEDENNHINYLLKCLNILNKCKDQDTDVTADETYKKLIEEIYERGIPSRIAKTGKKLENKDLLDYFILESIDNINTESAKKFIQSINEKHRISESLLYSITLLEPLLVDAINWRQDEIDAENNKIINQELLEQAIQAYTAANLGIFSSMAEYDMALYRADCEANDEQNNYEKAVDAANKEAYYKHLTEVSNYTHFFLTQFSNYWIEMHRPIFISINKNVKNVNLAKITYATGNQYGQCLTYESNSGVTMIRLKLCDILDKKGYIDYEKMEKLIRKICPDFSLSMVDIRELTVNKNIMVVTGGAGQEQNITSATVQAGYATKITFDLDMQKGSYMYNSPSRSYQFPRDEVPLHANQRITVSEFYRNPGTEQNVPHHFLERKEEIKKLLPPAIRMDFSSQPARSEKNLLPSLQTIPKTYAKDTIRLSSPPHQHGWIKDVLPNTVPINKEINMLSTRLESYRNTALSSLDKHNSQITQKFPTITRASNRQLQAGDPHTTTLLSNRSTTFGSQHNTSRKNRLDFQSLRHDKNTSYVRHVESYTRPAGETNKRPMPKLFLESINDTPKKFKDISEQDSVQPVRSVLKNTARKSIPKSTLPNSARKIDFSTTGSRSQQANNNDQQTKAITLQNIRTDGYWDNDAIDLAIHGLAGALNVQLDIEDHSARDNKVYLHSIGQTQDSQRIIRLRRTGLEGVEHYQLIDSRDNIINVKSDGNCLFRAIAMAINHDENNYAEFRERTARYIEENWNHYKEFIDSEQQSSQYYADNKRFITLWESIKSTAEKKLMDWSKFSGSQNDLIKILSGGIADPEKILTRLSGRDLQNLGLTSRDLHKVTEVFISSHQDPSHQNLPSLNGIPCMTKEGSTIKMDLELLAKFDERVSFIDNEGLENPGDLTYFKKYADNWYAMVQEAQRIMMLPGNYLPRQLTSKYHTEYPINPRHLFITNFPLDQLYALADEEYGDASWQWYKSVLQQNLEYYKFLQEHHPE